MMHVDVFLVLGYETHRLYASIAKEKREAEITPE